MEITEELINELTNNYNKYGIDSIRPPMISEDIMIKYIQTYKKVFHENKKGSRLEVAFVTLIAVWFTKNDGIEEHNNFNLNLFYVYRYYYQYLLFMYDISEKDFINYKKDKSLKF